MTDLGSRGDLTLYLVGIYVTATPESDNDDFETFFDQLWQQVLDQGDHGHMAGSVKEGRFTVWVEVEAQDPYEADLVASAKVRAAAVAIGAGADDWPEEADWPAGLRTEALEVREVREALATSA